MHNGCLVTDGRGRAWDLSRGRIRTTIMYIFSSSSISGRPSGCLAPFTIVRLTYSARYTAMTSQPPPPPPPSPSDVKLPYRIGVGLVVTQLCGDVWLLQPIAFCRATTSRPGDKCDDVQTRREIGPAAAWVHSLRDNGADLVSPGLRRAGCCHAG